MLQADTSALEALIQTEYKNVCGLLVRGREETLYEAYFNGYGGKDAFHVFSVTKSIVSLLIGIALKEGAIGSVEQRILDFFPAYTIKRGEKTIQRIRLIDLLTMTAPYKYRSAPYTKYFTSEDWVRASLDLLGGKGEIGQFRYAPLIGPDILTGVLAAATGQTPLSYAMEKLFVPLGVGVRENIVFHSKEEQFAIMREHHKEGWVADPKGVNTAGWGLFLTANDMALLGQLCLNNGSFAGKSLVPEAFLTESTQEHSRLNELRYGYLWWIIDPTEQSFAALGDGGNAIYVNKKRGLTVAIASRFAGRCKDPIDLIKTHIEPLFEKKSC